MSFLESTPLLSTGSAQLDGFFTITLILTLGGTVFTLGNDFLQQARSSKTRRHKVRRTREIQVFLLIAAAAFVTVTWLRFEHRRLTIVSWDEIDQWRVWGRMPEGPSAHDVHEGAKSVMSSASEGLSHAAEGVRSFAKNARLPASGEEVLDGVKKRMPSGEDVYEGAKTAGRKAGKGLAKMAGGVGDAVRNRVEDVDAKVLVNNLSIPKALHDRFVWMPTWWSRNASVWDFFKLLVDKYRYFWWTQQWMTGYLAWAVFVGIECQKRHLPSRIPISFILLGYAFSLASMQCLFYAYLLLVPVTKSRRMWVPHPWYIVVPMVLEVVGIVALPAVLARGTAQANLAMFNMVQIFVACWPGIVAYSVRHVVPNVTFEFYERYYGRPGAGDSPARIFKKLLSTVWFAISVLMLCLHIYTTFSAFSESVATSRTRWFIPGLGRVTRSGRTKETARKVLGSLGEHPWINAVGWDVLFSQLGLCLWAFLSDADVRGMLKCTLWPWLDETIEAVGEGVERVGEAVDPYARVSMEKAQQMREPLEEYARQGMTVAKETAGRASEWLEEHEMDLKSTKRRIGKAADALMQGLNDDEDDDGNDQPEEIDYHDDRYWQEAVHQSPRKRGASPRKSSGRGRGKVNESNEEAEHDGTVKRMTRSRSRDTLNGDPAVRARRQSKKRVPQGQERRSSMNLFNRLPIQVRVPRGVTYGAEAAGLAWALFSVGGLGVASAGVYGADEME